MLGFYKRNIKGIGVLVSLLVFGIMMFPYIWLGEGVKVNVWDNLDSNVAWYKMLQDQHKIFAGPTVMVEGMVSSTPRFSYPSGWNLEVILYHFLDVFSAYWVNKLLIALIAFLSMYVFVKAETKADLELVLGISLIWATLEFYPHRGISLAALPLIYFAFSRLRKEEHIWVSLLAIVFYGFYSMFVLAGFFVWVCFLLISSYWVWVDRKISFPIVTGLGIWIISYFIADHQLFFALFGDHGFESHRKEISYLNSIWTGLYPWDFLIQGNRSGVFYWWGYSIMALFFFASMYYQHINKKKIIFFFTLSLSLAVFCSLISLTAGVDQIGKWVAALNSLNLIRFSHIIPFGIFALITLGIAHLDFPFKRVLIIFCIGVNIFLYQYEWRNLLNEQLGFLPYKVPSFKQYYSEDLYRELKDHLGEEWENRIIGHINLAPAVSAYNGMTAVDGYVQNYELGHKKKIREVIAGELAKDQELEGHFDDWGNKCYLQNSTYPDLFVAYSWLDLSPIEDLDFEFGLLKDNLQTSYVLSAIEIRHERLNFLRKFSNREAAWEVYLYEIN